MIVITLTCISQKTVLFTSLCRFCKSKIKSNER